MIERVSHTKFVEKVQDLKYLILPFVAAASGVLGELLSPSFTITFSPVAVCPCKLSSSIPKLLANHRTCSAFDVKSASFLLACHLLT